jgi:hypothetical protein
MVCPTCKAKQEWSETCRRCKCDLTLLWAADRAYQRERQQCLTALRAGLGPIALAHARRCHQLMADAESARLLAVSQLAVGDFTGAIQAARLAD